MALALGAHAGHDRNAATTHHLHFGAFVRANNGSCSLVGGAFCSTAGLQGTQVSAGSRYNFSKRTGVYAMYSKVYNGFAARYSNLANGDPSSGSDISQFAVGIQHSF